MSATMFLGRVVLPAAAVLLALALAWHGIQNALDRTGHAVARPATGVSGPARQGADPRSGRVRAEGRVVAYPGADVTVGTEVLGTITSMPAVEKTVVRAGDLLAEMRADDVRASLHEAHSRLIEAEVGLRFEQARSRLDGVLPLLTGRETPAQTTEARREGLIAATARREAARAAIDRLTAQAAKYRILAPIGGVVVARHADPGETVSPAAPLFTIVDMDRLRVEAEIDEFDIPRVVPKAQVTITAEGYPGPGWRGQVEEIADVVVPRLTRPADPGRPADTRVLLVKIAFREHNPLKLGQRVEVGVEVGVEVRVGVRVGVKAEGSSSR